MTAVEDYISANNLPNVKCCRRYWLTDDEELVVDYGSHRRFFKLVPTCVTTKGQLKIWVIKGG